MEIKKDMAKRKKIKFEAQTTNSVDYDVGTLVWFATEDATQRVGLIVEKSKRGKPKVDILWQKSGLSYTVRRYPVGVVVSNVLYTDDEAAKNAVKRFCGHVLEKNSSPTVKAKQYAKKFHRV